VATAAVIRTRDLDFWSNTLAQAQISFASPVSATLLRHGSAS